MINRSSAATAAASCVFDTPVSRYTTASRGSKPGSRKNSNAYPGRTVSRVAASKSSRPRVQAAADRRISCLRPSTIWAADPAGFRADKVKWAASSGSSRSSGGDVRSRCS